jgi:hypothetical protein
MQPLLPAQTFDAEAAQETSPRREKAVEVAAEVAS